MHGVSGNLCNKLDILFLFLLEISLNILISRSIIDLGVLSPERNEISLVTSRSAISLQISASSGVKTWLQIRKISATFLLSSRHQQLHFHWGPG